jgi:hypothetical protein
VEFSPSRYLRPFDAEDEESFLEFDPD